jgi:hypothetical protein
VVIVMFVATVTTVSVRVLSAVAPPVSVTLKVSEAVPAAVGVPAMTPVEELSESPAGRVPDVMLQVSGDVPPLAANVCEYGVPTLPAARLGVVIARAAPTVRL